MSRLSTRTIRLAIGRIAVVCIGIVLLPQPMLAQEEMIVTARKRAENLQDVPLSITALTGQQLRDRGIQSNYDLAYFTPNFNTAQTVGRRLDRPVIRGMAAPSTRGEPNASYFIDGVYVSFRSSISTATLEAVQQTEVVRGPQSSQFGRATFAGAVNYVTRRPTDEFVAELNVKAGQHDDYKFGGWVSGPLLTNNLLFLGAVNWEKYDGQWRNALLPGAAYPSIGIFESSPQQGDSSRLGNEETQDYLAKLMWLPTDSTEVTVKYSFSDADDGHFPSLITTELNCWLPPENLAPTTQPGEPAWWRTTEGAFCGTFDATGRENRVNLPDFREGIQAIAPPGADPADFFTTPVEPGTRRKTGRLLLDVNQEFSGWTINAKASYSEDEFEQAFDLDHQEVRALFGLFSFYQETGFRDWSGEFRIASPADARIRTQLGGYYYDGRFKTRQRSFPGISTVLGGEPPQFADWEFRLLENVAVFGQLEVALTETLTLSAEARWGEDTQEIIPANNDCSAVSAKFDNVTPRFTLTWAATQDLNIYALAAKGNKPGSFNDQYFRPEVSCLTQAAVVASREALVEEEEQWTYELGLKSTWLDGRLTANFAAFYVDWTNQSTFSRVVIPFEDGTELPTTVARNAGKSEVFGLELDSVIRVNDALNLVVTYGFNNGEFIEGQDELLEKSTGNGNLEGKEIPSSPEHQIALGAVVRQKVTAEADFFLRADYIYESERWSQAANFGQIDKRDLVNLRAGVEADQWKVGAYVRNLLDDNTPLSTLNFVNFNDGVSGANGVVLSNGNTANMWTLNPQRGREWGLEFQYRIGSR